MTPGTTETCRKEELAPIMSDWNSLGRYAIVLINIVLDVVSARQCYNYKEDPRIRHCDNGCCGKDYAEYCCDITLQVVGSVVGGLIVLVIIAILAYYCYAKKTKWRRSGAGGGGILSRFGLRRNVSHVRPGPDVHSQPRRVPLPQPGHMSHAHIGTGYTQQMPGQYPDQNNLHRPVQPPLAPTAPMPPPYTIEPPPYVPAKGPSSQAPPSYSDVVYNTGQGYKYGDYDGVMPPPSN